MTVESLPKMFLSETEGWPDVVRRHPSVAKLLWLFVVPMSLIPPLMYGYSALVDPGAVVPLIEPPLSLREAATVGGLFVIAEVAMVMLMATFVQQLGQANKTAVSYQKGFTLAAIAPTPLWLAALALFVPSVGVSLFVGLLAWIGCVALLRHGVRPVLGIDDAATARKVANELTIIGVSAWVALVVLMGLLLSMVLGFR